MEGIGVWIITFLGICVSWLCGAQGLICCHLNLNQLLMDQKTIPRLFCQLGNFSKCEICEMLAWHISYLEFSWETGAKLCLYKTRNGSFMRIICTFSPSPQVVKMSWHNLLRVLAWQNLNLQERDKNLRLSCPVHCAVPVCTAIIDFPYSANCIYFFLFVSYHWQSK